MAVPRRLALGGPLWSGGLHGRRPFEQSCRLEHGPPAYFSGPFLLDGPLGPLVKLSLSLSGSQRQSGKTSRSPRSPQWTLVPYQGSAVTSRNSSVAPSTLSPIPNTSWAAPPWRGSVSVVGELAWLPLAT